jgi:hypothetical protein
MFEALALLWRRLRLGSASGVVCAAAHDHVGCGRLPGDHYLKGCEGLEAGSRCWDVLLIAFLQLMSWHLHEA